MMTHKTTLTTLSATGALLAALALAGCDRPANQQGAAAPGEHTTADAQRRGDELHADASRKMADAGDRFARAKKDVQGAGRSAADSATNAVSDAAITAQVNAQL